MATAGLTTRSGWVSGRGSRLGLAVVLVVPHDAWMWPQSARAGWVRWIQSRMADEPRALPSESCRSGLWGGEPLAHGRVVPRADEVFGVVFAGGGCDRAGGVVSVDVFEGDDGHA